MPARQPRVPWAPLWAYAADRGCAGIGDLARQCGQDVRDLHRWRRDGGIPERAADRVAVGLGVVPDLIWGEAWAEATAALVERAEVEEAVRRAKVAAKQRAKMKANPVYAERQRAKVKAWKAANAERVKRYHAEYQREWRERNRERTREHRRLYQQAYRARQREAERDVRDNIREFQFNADRLPQTATVDYKVDILAKKPAKTAGGHQEVALSGPLNVTVEAENMATEQEVA